MTSNWEIKRSRIFHHLVKMFLNAVFFSLFFISHRIHGTGVFTYNNVYIYHKNQLNAGKYTSPMDPMGYVGAFFLVAFFLEETLDIWQPGFFTWFFVSDLSNEKKTWLLRVL